VEAKAKERYYYPDLVVSCSERDRDSTLMVQDPVLIIEVLSEGSQKIDIYTKQTYYTWIPSLQVYMVVSQKEYVLHVYERHANGWSYQVVVGKDQQVHLEYFNLTIPVVDIYKHVRFNETTGGGDNDAGAVAP
jgi:Uma2 family endonuclease